VRYAVAVSFLTEELMEREPVSLIPTHSKFQQLLTGCFSQTNGSSHAPTPRVMASQPAKFSSYILAVCKRSVFFVCSL